MSFRLFIYYCALCGAWAAFVGWIVGRFVPPDTNPYLLQGLKAFLLGLTVALALGLVDAIWNVPVNRILVIALRGLTAVAIASVGAFLTGTIGEFFRRSTESIPVLEPVFFVLGWTATGLLIGASLGAFEIGAGVLSGKDFRGAIKKIVNGALGGTIGGFLGGFLAYAMRALWSDTTLLSPSAWGFVVLGLCIGLLIGLAQIILKEAWVKVEAGFRAGRELLLTKDETTIGRAESCDLGLFGDGTIEKVHARIKRVDGRFLLLDADSMTGTYVNDQRVRAPVPLRAGDAIRVGQSVLRFGERQKRRRGGRDETDE
jgi:hypothetical protein